PRGPPAPVRRPGDPPGGGPPPQPHCGPGDCSRAPGGPGLGAAGRADRPTGPDAGRPGYPGPAVQRPSVLSWKSVSSCLWRRQAFADLLNLAEDQVGVLGPDERPGVGVVGGQILLDGPLQLLHTLERPSPDAPLGDLGEEPLDLVEPGRTGRGEVHDVLRVPGEPLLDHRVLV